MLGRLAKALTNEIKPRVRRALNIPVRGRYDGFTIAFPPESRIVGYQQTHPRYDRFLPHLAGYLAPGDVVVDVGANVGDTLAGMAEKNDKLVYLCIEADDGYFGRLRDNLGRIRAARPSLQVQTVKALVGQNVKGAALIDNRGTKNAVFVQSGGMDSQPLDHILREHAPPGPIRLIKSDVDGFDYDVLDSSMEVMRRDEPLIFFEAQIDTEEQKMGLTAALRGMAAIGYADWTLLDNFGEVALRTSDLGAVEQLLAYVWAQTQGRSTRTIYYFDILVAKSRDKILVDRVVADFRQV